MLRCPVCGKKLNQDGKCFRCADGHTFDTAKEGYVNLLTGCHKNGSLIGDNKDMARSRRDFLEKGYYDFLAGAIADIAASQINAEPSQHTLLDIACGEGYYTEFIRKKIHCQTFGFDISREMIKLVAKKYKEISFFVANIARIPFADDSVNCAFQICAPFHECEFARILKPDGVLISVVPGRRHLWGLKELLYDNPYENNAADADYETLRLVSVDTVSTDAVIHGREDIARLFSMTPYFYKTSEKDKRKLLGVEDLRTLLEFDIRIFQKK